MALDARAASTVACHLALAAGLSACPRTTAPEAPGTEPTPPVVDHRAIPGHPGGSALVGELCMTGAGGRPGIAPLALRSVSWTTDADELSSVLERGLAGTFAVLGGDGRRVGVFTAIGATEQPSTVAVGSYAGASPCARPAAPGVAAADDPACVAATGGCGLAIAPVSSGGGFAELEPPDLEPGGACVASDGLVVDVDGDGAAEVFPLAGFLDGARAPADELSAAAAVPGACTPTFTRYGVAIAVDAALADPRHRVTLDVLGVVDVDGDGRRELVVGLRYAERRTIAVYTARDSAARLSLVGELEPWPRP